jgi:hypothetical protein
MIYDRMLIQIRERSFLDLLDLTLLVIRERPLALGLAALAGIAPFAALNVWLLSDPAFPPSRWIVLLLMEAPWVTAPLTLVLGDLMFSLKPSLKRYSNSLVVSLPALVFTQLVLRGLLLVTVIGYLSAIWRFAFLDEVILLDRLRWVQDKVILQKQLRGFLAVLRRSKSLSNGFESILFLRWMAQIVLGLTFALCFQVGTESISSTFIGHDLTWYQPALSDLSGFVFQIAVWIAIAFFGVFRFLSYIDRRIRIEGWELELRLREAGRGVEERVH